MKYTLKTYMNVNGETLTLIINSFDKTNSLLVF